MDAVCSAVVGSAHTGGVLDAARLASGNDGVTFRGDAVWGGGGRLVG